MNRDNPEKHSSSLGMNDCAKSQQDEFIKNLTEKEEEFSTTIIEDITVEKIADDIVFESTDRELFEITTLLYKRMDDTYKSQFLDNI